VNAGERLAALYAELPRVECTGRCWEFCGKIVVADAEARRIERGTGVRLEHDRRKTEGLVRALMANESLETVYRCPLLTEDRRCGVHGTLEPGICRLFGVAEGLECPFGCRPDHLWSKPRATRWMERVRAVR
jgi:hypothetical protein